MKKFNVLVDVYHSKSHVETKSLIVEAGNMRLATLRALGEISKNKDYTGLYKSIKRVTPVVQ